MRVSVLHLHAYTAGRNANTCLTLSSICNLACLVRSNCLTPPAQPRCITALETKLADAQTAYDAFVACRSGMGPVDTRSAESPICN